MPSKSKILVIVHYAPVDLYPPVQNLISELVGEPNLEVRLITGYPYLSDFVNVRSPRGWFAYERFPWLHHLWWFFTLWKKAWVWKHEKWLLYEANSYPALLALASERDIWLHFHEYRRPKNPESILERWYETRIRSFLHKTYRVSHVTDARIKLLKEELGQSSDVKFERMWNCPRFQWADGALKSDELPKTIVVVGALGKSCWASEVIESMKKQNKYTLHVYGKDSFTSTERVQFKGWVNYSELPSVLERYRVGLVWYNGNSTNVKTSISNKIFEYLHSGLHVLLSADLKEAELSLFPQYRNHISITDFSNSHWIKALDSAFEKPRVPNKDHHFVESCQPLLKWVLSDEGEDSGSNEIEQKL